MKHVLSIFIILIFMFSACSPTLNNKNFDTPLMDLKPDHEQDPEFAKLLQSANQFEMRWSGVISTAEVYEAIQGLLDLSEKYKNPGLKKAAGAIYKKYNLKPAGNAVSFFKTPYFETFLEEALPSVREAVVDGGKKIDVDLKKVKAKVIDLRAKYDWPTIATYRESTVLIIKFLDLFSSVIPKMKLMPDFQKALLDEVEGEKNANVDYLNKQLAAIESQKTLDNMILNLESMVKEFDIQLDKDSVDKIESGRKLALKINAIQDENSAFSAIIAVWKMLDAKEREDYIAPISAALYKFLNGRKPEELDCLERTQCSSFLNSLIRDIGILPQIRKFGVTKIKSTLNEKTHGYVLLILEERLLNVVVNLDARIIKKVERNVAKAKTELDKIKKNAQGYTKDKFLDWMKKNMATASDMTTAYDHSSVAVDLQKRIVTFQPPTSSKNAVLSRVIGTSLGAHSKMISTDLLDVKSLRRVILEQVNRVMGFGGLPTKSMPTKGLTFSFDGDSTPFDVGAATGSVFSFGLTDRITLTSPYVAKDSGEALNVSAMAQIELGTGMLALMKYLRDWESNSFDTALGSFRASDIFGGEKSSDDPVLFSKTDFFGLVTAQFLSWISNLNKSFSQVGLVTDSIETIWLNEYAKNKDKKLLFAVYVDFINGQRSDDVSLEPLVKLIRLLKSVSDVVTGIEKTKFKELQKKDVSNPECKDLNSPKCPSLAQFIASQVDEIKQILLPLGNTVASKYRKQKGSDASGLSYGKIRLSTLEPLENAITLVDQLLVIEALVHIYETTKIESYIWAAKETYSYLQKYYNPKSNFFEMEAKTASLPVVIQMLRSFRLLLPYLEETERIILTEKIKIWEFSIERIQ